MLNLIRLTVLRSQALDPSLPISTAESTLIPPLPPTLVLSDSVSMARRRLRAIDRERDNLPCRPPENNANATFCGL